MTASGMKARVISSDTAARSHCSGQLQSKSARGLKRPMCAALKRRSRPRCWRTRSSHSSKPGQPSQLRLGQFFPVDGKAMQPEPGSAALQFLHRSGINAGRHVWAPVSRYRQVGHGVGHGVDHGRPAVRTAPRCCGLSRCPAVRWRPGAAGRAVRGGAPGTGAPHWGVERHAARPPRRLARVPPQRTCRAGVPAA